MVETSRNVHPNVDSNRLPHVFRAVLDYIAMTGINPGLLHDLEINPFDTTIALSRVRIQSSRRQKPACSSQTPCRGAFREYIKRYRPKLVGRAVADGKEAPRHLFLMDDGTPITVEAFQSAMVRAMSRQRLPEITAFGTSPTRTSSAAIESLVSPLLVKPNIQSSNGYKPRRPALYDRQRFSETDLIECANTESPRDV